MSDLTGQTIAHFRVERRIGGGAMASVYQANNQILDRMVALKVLLPGADTLTRERFRQEARTVSKLEHPHIVQTFQVGQTSVDGVAYIAMELVEGQSLSSLLERYHTISVEDACKLLEPVARALAYAHQHGIVHRDVKPSNILLREVPPGTPDSVELSILDTPVVPLLSDFGIARALDSPELTSAGRTIGTPAYMAPEQCAGTREIDGRADIYSLGTVLYRCLVGRPPFVGTTTQILHAHVYEPLTIPDEVVYELPQSIVLALQNSLIKEPEHRYASASLMADDLAAAASADDLPKQADNAIGRPTVTMETVAATGPAESGRPAQKVLVPGGKANMIAKPRQSGGTPPSLRAVGSSGSTTHSRVPRVPPSTSVRRTNWVGIILGATTLLLLVLVGIALVRSLIPDESAVGETISTVPTVEAVPGSSDLSSDASDENGIATPPAEDDSGLAFATEEGASSEATGVAEPTDTNDGESARGGVNAETTPDETSLAIPSPTELEESAQPTQTSDELSATVTVTPTTRTPVIDIESTWADIQTFVDERDWTEALRYLTLVQRSDPDFEAEAVADYVSQSYVGLASQITLDAFTNTASAETKLKQAEEFLSSALEAQNTPAVAELLDTTIDYGQSSAAEQPRARQALRDAYAQHAIALAALNDFCTASEQMHTALRILYDAEFASEQVEFLKECPSLKQQLGPGEFIDLLDGQILYSSQRAGGTNQNSDHAR